MQVCSVTIQRLHKSPKQGNQQLDDPADIILHKTFNTASPATYKLQQNEIAATATLLATLGQLQREIEGADSQSSDSKICAHFCLPQPEHVKQPSSHTRMRSKRLQSSAGLGSSSLSSSPEVEDKQRVLAVYASNELSMQCAISFSASRTWLKRWWYLDNAKVDKTCKAACHGIMAAQEAQVEEKVIELQQQVAKICR